MSTCNSGFGNFLWQSCELGLAELVVTVWKDSKPATQDDLRNKMTWERWLEKDDLRKITRKMTWERWLEKDTFRKITWERGLEKQDDLRKMTWERWLENKHWSHGQMLWETMLEQIINMDCFDAYSKDFYRCVLWMKAETRKKLNHERKSWESTWQPVQVHTKLLVCVFKGQSPVFNVEVWKNELLYFVDIGRCAFQVVHMVKINLKQKKGYFIAFNWYVWLLQMYSPAH